MAVQNLVSASITPENKDKVVSALVDVKSRLSFLMSLKTSEISGIFKAGKEYTPLIELCRTVVKTHPEILPGVFDKEEFDRDCQLARDLGEISDLLTELSDGVAQTLTAVRSDALTTALDVYSAVKLSKDKVVGLGTVADNIGQYFKKSPRAKAATA